MIRNYFISAVRNLIRQKGFSIINISGLAIGMAIAILIFLWVKNELSYDKFNEKYSRIHRLVQTQHYSSKTPYAFNAGGTGTDLLRMQTYAERLGFKIDFSSQRCRFIPGDADACPGSVSLCEKITAASDCMVSGGSLFMIRFPKFGA